MTGKKYILAGASLGVWLLGYQYGVAQEHSSTPPAPKVIHKTVTHTVTHTHTEYRNCPGLLDSANQLGALAAVVTRDSGLHVDTMTAGGEAIYSRDIKRLNVAMQKEYNLKSETDVAATGIAQTTAAIQQELKQCSPDNNPR